MNKSLLAVALTASILIVEAPQLARAQDGTPGGYTSGQMLQQGFARSQAWYNSAEARRQYGSDAPPQRERGQAVIKSGRATIIVPRRAFPLDYYQAVWARGATGDIQKARAENLASWRKQSAYWQAQIKVRNAKPNNMAQMQGLAMVMAYEAYSGQKVSNAGFRYMSECFRKDWLHSALYQGKSTASKQALYEEQMLAATYAWACRRDGEIGNAKAAGQKLLDEWWGEETPGVAKDLAPFLVK